MLEIQSPNGHDLSYDSPDAIFLGIRFVLFGFDPVSEIQYRSELVNGKGIDVGQYDSSCTHVIVHRLVYDDPVCVAARHAGKMVVTELWVEDSLELGKLADASKILYRPVKDLNGIPGCDSLCICLTGYQKQERDYIMKMVGLMGAHFTKPLQASRVTHLICYKFEGEKYDLARMLELKRVNHRWLEDCLKAWKVLPEDEYSKMSGWELEISEAEARDSEEETDKGIHTTPLGQKHVTGSLLGLQGRIMTPRNSELAVPVEVSRIQQHVDRVKESYNIPNEILMNDRQFSTLNKVANTDKAASPCVPRKDLEEEFRDPGVELQVLTVNNHEIEDALVGEDALIICDTISSHKKEAGKVSSEARTSKRSPNSDASDDRSTLYFSRKTPRKSRISVSPELPNCGFACRQLEENKISDVLNILPLTSVQAQNNLESGVTHSRRDDILPLIIERAEDDIESGETQSPRHGKEMTNMERESDTLHEMRKEAVSRDDPKSPMEENFHKTEAYAVEGSTRGAKSAKLDVACSAIDTPSFKAGSCLNYKSNTLKEVAPAGTLADKHTDPPRNQSLTFKKSLKCVRPPPRTKIAEHTVSSSIVQAVNLQDEGEPRLILGKHVLDTANCLDTFVTESSDKVEKISKEKMPTTSSGSLEKSEFALKTANEGILLSRSLNLCVSEIAVPAKSNQADDEADARNHKGNRETKTASEVSKKTMAKKNLSCRPKLSAGNLSRHGNSSCSDGTIAQNQVANFLEKGYDGEPVKTISEEKTEMVSPTCKEDIVKQENLKGVKRAANRTKRKYVAIDEMDTSMDAEKENKPFVNGWKGMGVEKQVSGAVAKPTVVVMQNDKVSGGTEADRSGPLRVSNVPRNEQQWFILSGHHLQRKEFQQVIKHLRGRLCRDSHHWSYQATHFILPDPVRRTEKFFAAAAAGRWILKTDYLTASNQAGRFLAEEPFEWHKSGFSEDGAVNLEAPRKWRLLKEKTGHGAFYGMRIIIYGECIAPSLDTLKRVVKAGDGTILATSPPYYRVLKSGVDFAVVSPGMPRVDLWVQEFLSHEVPCVLADYLVEYICKPGYSLERHVLYKTHTWAEKSYANQLSRLEEIVEAETALENDDLVCQVCGSGDRGEVMLICGDDTGSLGCGIGVHIDCYDPPLEAVPKEDWFCSKCKTSTSSNSSRSTVKNTTRRSATLKCK